MDLTTKIKNLPEFPLDDDCMFLLMIGKSRSGKSYLSRHVMYEMIKRNPKIYRMIYVWSATCEVGDYGFCAQEFQSNIFQPEVLEKIISMQKKEIESCAKTGKIPRRVIIVLDDVIGMCPFQTLQFQSLLTTYRHYHIELIIMSQYLNKIPTFARENASLVCLFNLKIKLSIQSAYDSYGGCCFDSYTEWKKFLNEMAVGHQCLIVHQTQSSELIDNFSTYTAPGTEVKWRFEC